MDRLILFLDKYIIFLFRLTGDPLLNFFIGGFLLALSSVIIGEFTISIAFMANKRHIDNLNRELVESNNLSIKAVSSGDKEGYRKYNDMANDAFGKLFFNMIALSAASLWPVFFALSWMQYRFIEIEFPLIVKVPLFGKSVGYVFFFVLFYILAKILFKNLKYKLPYFRNIPGMLKEYEGNYGGMMSIADFINSPDKRSKASNKG
jgi:hypothetical protein